MLEGYSEDERIIKMLVLNCSNYNIIIICFAVALFIILLYSFIAYMYFSTGTVELDSSTGLLFYHHDKNKERHEYNQFIAVIIACVIIGIGCLVTDKCKENYVSNQFETKFEEDVKDIYFEGEKIIIMTDDNVYTLTHVNDSNYEIEKQ